MIALGTERKKKTTNPACPSLRVRRGSSLRCIRHDTEQDEEYIRVKDCVGAREIEREQYPPDLLDEFLF